MNQAEVVKELVANNVVVLDAEGLPGLILLENHVAVACHDGMLVVQRCDDVGVYNYGFHAEVSPALLRDIARANADQAA